MHGGNRDSETGCSRLRLEEEAEGFSSGEAGRSEAGRRGGTEAAGQRRDEESGEEDGEGH